MNKTKLEFTWKLILKCFACSEGKELFLSKHPEFDVERDLDKPINLLELLRTNGIEHALWALRATIQDSKAVSIEIANRAAKRAKEYATRSFNAAEYAARAARAAADAATCEAGYAYAATRAADHAAYFATRAAAHADDAAIKELEHQTQDLIDLLKE